MITPSKRKMRHGKIRGLVAIAAVSILLSACSGSNGGASQKVVKLTIWGAQSTTQAIKDELTAYEKKTGITMNFVTIPDPYEANIFTKWTTGQRPDILLGQPAVGFLRQLNAKKNLQDLSGMSFISKTKYSLAKESGALDGVSYTATTGFPAVFGMFYNKKVFSDNGLKPPTTQAEFQAVLKAFKSKGVTGVELAGGDTWTLQLPYIEKMVDAVSNGFVTSLNKNKEKYTTNTGVKDALAAEKSLVDNGYVNADWKTATFADQASALQSGAAAMVIQGSWMLPSLTGDTSSIGFIAYPTSSGKVMWQTSNLTSLQAPITKNAAQEKAARDYIDWATTGDGYKSYLAQAKEPSVIEGVSDPAGVSALQKEVAVSFSTNGIPSLDMQLAVGISNLPDLISQWLIGSLTMQQITEQMQAGFVENAKTAGIPGF